MNQCLRLKDKVIVVTGGGDGVGFGIVKVLVQQGATVIAAELDSSRAAAVEQLSTENGKAIFWQTDVSDESSIAKLFQEVAARFQGLDGLVNNAGVTLHSDFLSFSIADCDFLYKTNLRSGFICTQYAAKLMIERGCSGSIVNLASNHADASVAGFEMYAATKGGIVAMTRAMALSLGPKGIRVNTLSPGFTTNKGIAAAIAENPSLLETYNSLHPTGRFNQPEDVGQVAAFLLSDDAIGIVGSNILADNGMSALLFNRAR